MASTAIQRTWCWSTSSPHRSAWSTAARSSGSAGSSGGSGSSPSSARRISRDPDTFWDPTVNPGTVRLPKRAVWANCDRPNCR